MHTALKIANTPVLKRVRRLTTYLSCTLLIVAASTGGISALAAGNSPASPTSLDAQLATVLQNAGFTGKVASTLTTRLGRPLNPELADLGRKLFFDPSGGLHDDNTCAGCHAPATGFGDTQSIAIGVQNNNLVGPNRKGPRNQRRTPTVINTPFYPKLMWNDRFSVVSGNPFDNSQGFVFPVPEGTTKFPAKDPIIRHLLIAQAHMPPTELTEAAGFTGTKNTDLDPRLAQFDDGLGSPVPLPDASGFRNDRIRAAVMARLNANKEYVELFGKIFPEVAHGKPITPVMFAQAIAEFEFTLVRADAPIDQFARGKQKAMSDSEKRGALLFFGKANCVSCHAVSGQSNEMFSDFKEHVAAIPQIAPYLGVGLGNVIFDGPGVNEDFGLEQFTGDSADRYKFRSSPLRNLNLQPSYFHNGSFVQLSEAVAYHINTTFASRQYSALGAGVASDLTHLQGPMDPVLQKLDPLLKQPIDLSRDEFNDLVQFLETGLLDKDARPEHLCKLVPKTLPSNYRPLIFEGCSKAHDDK